MHLFQTDAVIVALQALLALTKLQGGNAYGIFILIATVFYAALAHGLWKRVVWIVPLGLVVTLAQTIILSTQTFSWRCLLG